MIDAFKVPEVGSVLKVDLKREADPEHSILTEQYKDHTGRLCELVIPYLDGIHLRNLITHAESEMNGI